MLRFVNIFLLVSGKNIQGLVPKVIESCKP